MDYAEDDALGSLLNHWGRPLWYNFDGTPIKNPTTASGYKAIERLCASPKRRIASTWLKFGRERVRVLTVFLMTNYNFGDGPPILWETMVFGGPADEQIYRYQSRDAAIAGHRILAESLRTACIREARRLRRERRERRHRLARVKAAFA